VQPVLGQLYSQRFTPQERARKGLLWQVLYRDFFSRYIDVQGCVLEVGCGFGDFINAVQCRRRIAVDLNAQAVEHLDAAVEFLHGTPEVLAQLPAHSVSVIFASNFLEHLRRIDEVAWLFRHAARLLMPGGRVVLMGPNVRFLANNYWDFFDHRIALSDRGIVEGLRASGFTLERVEPRFLPYTIKGRLPAWVWALRAYLRFPWAWRIFGKQFLIVART
jgi:SAM-dependent methyltransferase